MSRKLKAETLKGALPWLLFLVGFVVTLCGCAVPQRWQGPYQQPPLPNAETLKAESRNGRAAVQAAVVSQPPVIRLEWTAGAENFGSFVQLPRTSGIESSQDRVNWFAETNRPVTSYRQWF